ncbi:unnamed protein product [Miscanthus lutarioriparius]|uniref:Major facilitator superfamily (MFS) profile domain-containing protein n=1 Tax=Miscanthus lutarioriparius TaxID=422564 RepID=A0A811RFS5_9POAL|nr:unnamed protein product [Miscanthus lutarioriparius]
MIRDLHAAKRTEDIGLYAGFVGASFMLGRCLTSTAWGIAADRIGRKPVVMVGILSVVIFNTLFELSTSYWMAIATRFLLGALNGLLGPIKAYAIEICGPEHEALGLSLVSTAWWIGLIIGPALGGYLALETLHKHKVHENENKIVEALEAHLIDSNEKVEKLSSLDGKKSLFKNWPLMSSIIMYCVFSIHDMAYTEVFSLWAESDKKYGGLSLSSQDVGQVLSITGVSLIIYQLSVYPWINKILGPAIKSSRIAAITIVTSTFILQNNAVPQDQRGAANGLSMTVMSLFKAVAPAGAGIVFSWAQRRQQAFFFPGLSLYFQFSSDSTINPHTGDQMVFFLLSVVEFLGLVLTFKPFMVMPEQQYDRN